MLETVTRIVETIEDVTSLSKPEIFYLITVGWHEYRDEFREGDTTIDDYDYAMMETLCDQLYDNHIIEMKEKRIYVKPADGILDFILAEAEPVVEIKPSASKNGVDVIYKYTDSKRSKFILHISHWSFEELLENDFIC